MDTPCEIYQSKQKYKLGDPTKAETNLGPVVSVASAERIRKQVADAGKSSMGSMSGSDADLGNSECRGKGLDSG